MRRISGYVSNLSQAVRIFGNSRTQDPTIKAMTSVVENRDDAMMLRKMVFLKSTGANDPNVDLWVALMGKGQDQEARMKAALEAGADVGMTNTQVLANHARALEAFVP